MRNLSASSSVFSLSSLFLLGSFLIFSFLSVSSAQTQGAPAAQSFDEIDGVLHAQQDAWNRHDLDGFMAGYWNSPQLTFFSGATERDGWQATMDRYRAAYASPGHEMGKLEFSALRIVTLG